jgi:hypothetical protein
VDIVPGIELAGRGLETQVVAAVFQVSAQTRRERIVLGGPGTTLEEPHVRYALQYNPRRLNWC